MCALDDLDVLQSFVYLGMRSTAYVIITLVFAILIVFRVCVLDVMHTKIQSHISTIQKVQRYATIR